MKTLSQSPTDPAFVQDPYPFYARARAAGPLVFWSDYAMPVATTHAAVNALLRDRRFGREPVTPREIPDHLAPFYAVEAHSMLELEPPRHTRLRSPRPARLHQPADQGAGAGDRGADRMS
jgi:cytochrome P450